MDSLEQQFHGMPAKYVKVCYVLNCSAGIHEISWIVIYDIETIGNNARNKELFEQHAFLISNASH